MSDKINIELNKEEYEFLKNLGNEHRLRSVAEDHNLQYREEFYPPAPLGKWQ